MGKTSDGAKNPDASVNRGIAKLEGDGGSASTELEDEIDYPPRPWRVPGVRFGWLHLGILVGAFILFVIGVLIEQAKAEPDAYPALVRSCVQHLANAPSCDFAINEMHERTHTFLYFNLWTAAAEAFKALAIAIAVTVGVATILEGRSRYRLNAELTARANKIAENVLDGVLGNKHSPELLETLKRQILNRSVVRENLDMRYTLHSHEGKGRLAGQRFTMLKAHVQASFKNIATTPGSGVHLPLELSLPNPLLNELKKMVRLEKVTISRLNHTDRTFTQAELDAANEKLQHSLTDDEALEGHVHFGVLDLMPGETGGFEINYIMMKEAEDSELLRSFHTTSKLTLTVIDRTKRNLFIRAKAIHPGKLRLINGEDGVSNWALDDIILPQQGVLIWWKVRPPAPAKKPRRSPTKRAAEPVVSAVARNAASR